MGVTALCIIAAVAAHLHGADASPLRTRLITRPALHGPPTLPAIVTALGASDRIASTSVVPFGPHRGAVLVVGSTPTRQTSAPLRSSVAAAWTAFVIAGAYIHGCVSQQQHDACPHDYIDRRGGHDRLSGQLLLRRGSFPEPLPGLAGTIALRLRDAGLQPVSVEVDDPGVTVAIISVRATDPGSALRSRVVDRRLLDLHFAATLTELTDAHGRLVSIEGICNLCSAGVGWTAPAYRRYVSVP